MKLPTPKKTASGTYRMQMRLGGKSIVITGATAAECRREATVIKSEHLTGRVIQKRCSISVTKAIDKYIDARPKLSPSTVRGYRAIQKGMFKEAMPKMVDSVDWQKVIDADTHAPKTVRNAWGFIVSVLKDIDIVAPNVRLPAKIHNERPFLQPDQIHTFLDAIHGTNVELAALLGLHSLRRSEILDVTYGDIDIEKKLIHVRGAAVIDENNEVVHKSENKNATSARDVPIMIPRLIELVEKHKGEKTDYLVTCHPNTIWKSINRICADNGLPLIGCHGLRHSFISLAYHLGWSELATMRVAGFSNYQTMRKIYTHLAEKDKDADVKSMSAFFGRSGRKQTVSKLGVKECVFEDKKVSLQSKH